MKNLWLYIWLVVLLGVLTTLTTPLQAQGGYIPGQVITPAGKPAAYATVRVCPYIGGGGLPCSPLSSIYSDPGLTQPVSNPYTTDAFGNFSVAAAAGNYIVQLGITGTATTYSYFYTVGSAGGGPGTVTNFSSGNLAPLFTTSVANPTTTPAQSFTLSTTANFTFYGNFSGATSAPKFWTLAEGTNVTLVPSGGNTLTVNATGGGTGCVPSGTTGYFLYNNGSGCTGGYIDEGVTNANTTTTTDQNVVLNATAGADSIIDLKASGEDGIHICTSSTSFDPSDCPTSGSGQITLISGIGISGYANGTIDFHAPTDTEFTLNGETVCTASNGACGSAFSITSFTGGEAVELGFSVVNPVFNATYSTTPTSANITNTDSINSPFTLTTPFTTATITGTFVHTAVTTTVFTLSATHTTTATATQNIAWEPRIFGGVGAAGATSSVTASGTTAILSTGDVLSSSGLGAETVGETFGPYSPSGQNVYLLLTGGSHTFIDAGTGFPFAFNAPTTVSFVNSHSVTVTMYLYQSTNPLFGSYTPKIAS